MTAPHILIVEDEENLAETLRLNLKLEDFEVTVARNGRQALREIESNAGGFNLVLLDVMLPDIDGYAVCREIRTRNALLPVIFLTARNLKSDKIEGLRLGADDYITKPFDLEELLLRVNNVIRRSAPGRPEVFRFGDCSVNFNTFEAVTADARRITLSKREIGLLQLLTANPGKVVSRDEIIGRLWSPGENASSRTIDNYILGFRKYFESNPREPRHFHSIRGVGYRFTA